jgi:uncharacterized protein (DUF58 family)
MSWPDANSAPLTLRERLDIRRFFEGEKAREGPILLNHRRVFILPNRRGLALGLLLFIQLLAATNYSNNLAFILDFLLASIALLGILHGFRNLAGVSLRAGLVSPVFAGESACFEVLLENPRDRPRISLNMTSKSGTALHLDLPPRSVVPVKLAVPTERRGWLNLPTLTLASTFPLGLFRCWSPVNLTQRALVYPRPAPPGLPFPSEDGDAGRRKLSSDDFHGFQAYQPGDPLKRIHWKGVAKGQGVHVKEYRAAETADLNLDYFNTPGAGTEARLRQLCRWILDAEQAGIRYRLSLPGATIAAAQGPAHSRQCLEALALFGS